MSGREGDPVRGDGRPEAALVNGGDATGEKLPVIAPMDRRTALKVMAAAAAAPGVAACGPGEETPPSRGAGPAPRRPPLVAGTPTDPHLLDSVVPWEGVLTEDELQTLASLCDVIIPRDARSPGAGELGAQHFIDEWVGAPYAGNERDRVLIRGGLVWIDREAAERFGPGRRFRDLTDAEKTAICDDICWLEEAEPRFEAAARFFDRVRDLTSTAFWTTDEGMEDIGYVGNTPLDGWDPPPDEALRHLGLA